MSIKRLFKPKPTRTILLVGLNNSGKTTLLCNLVISMLDYARDMENIDQVSTCPTPGLSLVEFQQGRIKWRVWDMSGQGRFRNLWAYYSGHVQGIVFCVDVTDGDRIATARDELQVREGGGGAKRRRSEATTEGKVFTYIAGFMVIFGAGCG
jgi:GTPase SAR1 family protein